MKQATMKCHSKLTPFHSWVRSHFVTVAQFAEVLEVSYPTAQKYIKQPRTMKVTHIGKLATITEEEIPYILELMNDSKTK
jgi:predicted site-specific integrase-resolvase